MITQEKINEVRKMLREGEPQGELVEKLKAEGYSEDDISKIFTAHGYDMRSWYLTFAVIFLLIGLYLMIAKSVLLMLAFSVLMFLMYFREVERLKKLAKKDEGAE